MNIPIIIFFCKCRRIRLKLVIFLFYDLPACTVIKRLKFYHYPPPSWPIDAASLIMFLHS